MKTLARLYYWLTLTDYDKSIKSASNTTRMIEAATSGRVGHFYNNNGDKIRGYHKHIKFTTPVEQHPLITKYN